MRYNKKNSQTMVFWILSVLWILLLFFLSGQNATQSGELSIGLSQTLLKLFPFLGTDPAAIEHAIRKITHFCCFAVEGLLFALALFNSLPKKKALIIWPVISAAMAICNELYQLLAEGRSCEIGDMLLDFGGAVFGLIIVLVVNFINSDVCVKRKEA